MLGERRKILFGLDVGRRAETFVVLDLPARAAVVRRFPLVVLGNAEETVRRAAFAHFHNGRQKLLHEAAHFEQRRPQFVDHVDYETFDV